MLCRASFALAVAVAAVVPGTVRAQAITFDSFGTGTIRGAQTLSWSHTVGAGSNRLLVVGTATEQNPINGNSAITGITYGGVALTHVTGGQQIAFDTTAGTENYADLWFMLNPPTGTATVAVTATGTVADILGGSSSYSNVRQQAPEAIGGNATTTTTTFTNLSANITTVSPNALVVDVGLHSTSNGTMTPGAGQTEVWDISTAGARSAFSFRLVPTPGSVTDSWTADGNPQGRMAMSLAEFAPVAAVPEPSAVVLAGAGGLLLAAWRRRRNRGGA